MDTYLIHSIYIGGKITKESDSIKLGKRPLIKQINLNHLYAS